MLWIGLTGGIASGKSTVAHLLREAGIPVADADHFAKEAVQVGSPGLQEVTQTFGPDYINADGSLNRAKMGRLTFSNPAARDELENIIHPKVRAAAENFRQLKAREGHRIAVYDVPLLFEKNLKSQFDKIIVVTASRAHQIERGKKRTGLSEDEIVTRISSQIPLDFKAKHADFLIDNNGTLEQLKTQVSHLVDQLKHLS